MKLSIITLTYNKLEYTKKYIESLYKYTKDFELIIVDNGSTDGTVDYIKSLQKDNIKLIVNNENLGFSKGNNQGLEIATGEYLGFLNNDILLSPDWFEECEKVFEKENAAFVSPREVTPIYDCTNEYKFLKYFKKQTYKINYQKSFDSCRFACVITKRNVINDIGMFDEIYTPAFFEDNDIKYRAIEANYGVYVANRACFFHFGSITSIEHTANQKENRQTFHSRYAFAEYLSCTGDENDLLKRQLCHFKIQPLKCCHDCYLLWLKIFKRIKKILK